MTYAFKLALGRQKQAGICEVEVSVVLNRSSRLDRDTNTVRFCERRIKLGIAVGIGGGRKKKKTKSKKLKNAKIVVS